MESIILIVPFIVGFWFIFFFICKSRVREKLIEDGFKVISIRWAPFGYGWFGEKDSFIFKVRYEDLEGKIHKAYYKSGIFSGVYSAKDEIDYD